MRHPHFDRLGVVRRVLFGAFLAGRLHPLSFAAQLDDRPTEYEVKAAYLYNFVRFVEWPPEATPALGSPFIVAILGDDQFGDVFESVTTGRTLANRSTKVVRIREPGEAADAQVVFVAASRAASLPRLIEVLEGRSVLTIGDDPAMARSGTIIAFRNDGSRIRFDINLERAAMARLKLSAQLLRVATLVGTDH